MDAKTRKELEDAFAAAANLKPPQPHIIVDPNALERKFTIPERNRAIVREFRKVLENGYTDKKGYLRKPLLGKTIVFAVTKRHAETLAPLIDAEFADLKPSPEMRYADYVVSGMGQGEDTVDGMAQHQALQEGDIPADSGVGEHARHRLRLPRSRQSDLRTLHQVGDPVSADAGPRHAQGAGQAALHHVRFRRRRRPRMTATTTMAKAAR